MTRKKYLDWEGVTEEIEEILGGLGDLTGGVDFAHWVAERIRQLGRDMQAPTGPVIHEEKEE